MGNALSDDLVVAKIAHDDHANLDWAAMRRAFEEQPTNGALAVAVYMLSFLPPVDDVEIRPRAFMRACVLGDTRETAKLVLEWKGENGENHEFNGLPIPSDVCSVPSLKSCIEEYRTTPNNFADYTVDDVFDLAGCVFIHYKKTLDAYEEKPGPETRHNVESAKELADIICEHWLDNPKRLQELGMMHLKYKNLTNGKKLRGIPWVENEDAKCKHTLIYRGKPVVLPYVAFPAPFCAFKDIAKDNKAVTVKDLRVPKFVVIKPVAEPLVGHGKRKSADRCDQEDEKMAPEHTDKKQRESV